MPCQPPSNRSILSRPVKARAILTANETASEPVVTEPKAEEQPKPVEPEPDSGPSPKGKTQFTVQIMATSSLPKAQEQVAALKAKGYTPHVDEYRVGSSKVYKVRVGKFSDSADAKELAVRLKKDLRIDTWVAILE